MHRADQARAEAERARRTAQESGEHYRALVENINVGITRVDAEYRVLMINEAQARMFRKPVSELLGRHCYREFEKREAICAHCPGTRAMSTGQWSEVEIEGVRDDGSRVMARVRAFPTRAADGSISGFIEVIEDITRRKHAEEALRESEEVFRSISSSALDAIIMIDHEGCVSFWNESAERMFGYSKEEVIGRMVHELIAPVRLHGACQRGIAAFQECGRGPDLNKVAELTAVRKNQEEFPVELSLSAVKLRGKWHAVGIIRDITERKKVERQLQEAKADADAANRELASTNHQLEMTLEQACQSARQARTATQAKSAFLANMSHEIRAPLTSILGFAENLLDADLSAEERTDAIHTIRRNGEHLLSLVNNILDLAKIESERVEIESLDCNPTQLVAEVRSAMRGRAENKGLKLITDFVGPIPQTMHTDPTRLRQILINLVSNAIKFTSEGSVAIVTQMLDQPPSPAPPNGRRTGSLIQFEVIDTGIGITPAQLARLFRPFTQADSSTTRRFGGTGLGLAISRRLAQMLGGDITAESTPGHGSTFRVRVAAGPLEEGSTSRSSQPADADARMVIGAAALHGSLLHCRVLLAEDGPDNQRLLSCFLVKAGAEVSVVGNGRLALEAALAAWESGPPFDVVVMDMHMPIMDGYTATRRLRGKGYRWPIVALTAHAMSGDRERCLEAGCDDYATKPIDRARLIAVIQKQLQRWSSGVSLPVSCRPQPAAPS
jgi:PAS domain S-box-containing protein